MFSSLRFRLWLSYALSVITALFVVAVIFFIYLFSNPLVFRQTALRLAAVEASTLARQSEWSNLPVDQLQSAITAKAGELDVRLLIVTPQRQILADSHDSAGSTLEIRPLYRIFRLNPTLQDNLGRPWIYVSRRMDNGNLLLAAVLRPRVSIWSIFSDELVTPLMWGGLLGLSLALFLAFWMSRWVADPLQQVISAAGSFSGSKAKILTVDGPREVKDLAAAFNQMTERVQASQLAQRQFVANVSHELKTPLTSIQGFSQAILDGTAASTDQQQQAARVIYDEAARMHRLVLNLLDLARLDSGIKDLKNSPVDLTAILNSLGERFSIQAKEAEISLYVENKVLPLVTGDGDRLAQVFSNLVENALKFTPRGGSISIKSAVTDSWLDINIEDTGIGIPAENLPRIFDRFYQVDSARQGGEKHGAGLGLAIVHEIIRAHSGKVIVQSLTGKGSVFTVRLPLKSV